MMTRKILCVDDDLNVLMGLARQYGRRFEIHTALGCENGIMALKNEGPFAVVVSDLRMPGLDGIRFLSVVNRVSPDTVLILLTGQGDPRSEKEARDEGKVFQFLTKPCPPDTLEKTLESALERYREAMRERDSREKMIPN
jgi:DNA-binding NtrC family response regulator